MLLSKLVCDTDEVVSGSAALAVGVDEALLIADAHEAAGANGEAFLWLSAIYGRFRVVLHLNFVSDAAYLCSRSCHCWSGRLESGQRHLGSRYRPLVGRRVRSQHAQRRDANQGEADAVSTNYGSHLSGQGHSTISNPQ